jgi:hypothetical protein
MNYNNRYPAFSFRIDFNLKRKLDKLSVLEKISTNEFARKIITMYLKNELVKKTEDLQTEKTKLQIEKLKQEIEYMKIKNAFATNFNQPLSRSATVHIKPEIIVESPDPYTKNVEPDINWKKAQRELIEVGNKISPYDASNKRLQCVECGCLFGWQNKDEYVEKMGELKNHLLLKHDRPFNALEREVIDNLTYEGVST